MTENLQDEPVVKTSVDGAVARIVLARPAQLNAMTEQMVNELLAALDQVSASEARVLLVTAEGRGFCAGRDIAGAQPGTEDGGQVLADIFNPLVERVAAAPLPTIAGVQGACLGTGLGLALACDVVIVTETAKIGSPFVNIGAVLDSGAHKAFVERLGPARSLELIYSGRLISGQQAAEWGLVSSSVPEEQLEQAVTDLGARIAAGPTAALMESKRLVRRLLDEHMSRADVLAAEAEAQSRASRTRDYVEGFTAFVERRKPEFVGR
jgi:2-(1,2-epoxy-1,2-dihydrophenyl)acetyl-CoA isomerase